MAVNVDTVYQKVLAIANKEQRGYITPQEFNLFANQAQHDIFEQYFYDLNQFSRVLGNSTEYSDMVNLLEEKISPFKVRRAVVNVTNQWGDINLSNDATDLYRLGSVFFNDILVEKMEEGREKYYYENSTLTKATKKRPIYTRLSYPSGNFIKILPHPHYNANTNTSNDDIRINYVKKPKNVKWGYMVVNTKALYNSTTSTNFDLIPAEESDLVNKILILAGVLIKDPSLYQIAAQEEIKEIQQEKQ